LTGDVTPVNYYRYQCTVAGSGESYKAFQFPICQNINATDQQQVTFGIWAKVESTPITANIYSRQYWGSDAIPGQETATNVGSISVSSSWSHSFLTFIIPNTATDTLGACGDDALYLQFSLPVDSVCDVYITKPVMYMGNIQPPLNFLTYDQQTTIPYSERTGDIKIAMSSGTRPGWLPFDGATIGSGSSGAIYSGDNLFPLYKTLWDSVFNVFLTISGGKGGTSYADFTANKTLKLSYSVGHLLGIGNPGINEQPGVIDITTDIITFASGTNNYFTGTPLVISPTILPMPAPLNANIIYYSIYLTSTTIKLAYTIEDAIAGSAINITGTPSGIYTFINPEGAINGSSTHTNTIAEMAVHNHPGSTTNTRGVTSIQHGNIAPSSVASSIAVSEPVTVASQGGGQAYSILPPTLFMNFYVKL